jgi:hypothetical protein
MSIQYNKNVCKMDQVSIQHTIIFHCKTLQNLPKLGFLVWNQTIWQPWISATNLTANDSLSLLSRIPFQFGLENILKVQDQESKLLLQAKKMRFDQTDRLQNRFCGFHTRFFFTDTRREDLETFFVRWTRTLNSH